MTDITTGRADLDGGSQGNYSNSYEPPVSKQTNPVEKPATTTQTTLKSEGERLIYCEIKESAPFNEYTKQIRSKVSYSGYNLFIDANYKSLGIFSSIFTPDNLFFIRTDGKPRRGKLYGGGIYYGGGSDDLKKAGESKGYAKRTNKYYNNWLNTPKYSVIPNCLGNVRGRYQELQTKSSLNIKGSGGGNWINDTDWPFKRTPKFPINGIKMFWKDTNGTFGPKDGIWGMGKPEDGAPALPGAYIIWPKGGSNRTVAHPEFIEAVYNFGQPNEYIITQYSSYGNFDERLLTCKKRTKQGKNAGKNYTNYKYAHSATYYNAYFLYTPLCFQYFLESNPTSSEGDLFVQPIELNYEQPSTEQVEAYEKIKEAIANSKGELKVGDKVEIQWIGNQKPGGDGKKVNRLFMVGYIKRIHDSGLAYPYEVLDRAKGGTLLGYFSRDGLKLIRS